MVNTKRRYKMMKKEINLTSKKSRKSFIKNNKSKKNKKGGMKQEDAKVAEEEKSQITILVRTSLADDHEIRLEVNKKDKLYESICKGLLNHEIDCREMWNVIIYFAEEPLEKDETFNDLKIHDGARLSVLFKNRATFEQVIDDIIDLNPQLTDITPGSKGEELREHLRDRISNVRIHPEEPWRIENDLVLDSLRINELPDSFSSLIIDKDLSLCDNKLTSLPENFGRLSVRDLDLSRNKLTSLPESFGSLTLRDLYLHHNQLTSFPESVSSLTVNRDFYLSHNPLSPLSSIDEVMSIFPNVKGEVVL